MSTDAKVWLITGSSSGFGRALAEAALAAGHRVVATARRPEVLAKLAARYPETCRALRLDVTQSEQVKAAVAGAVEVFGRIDVLVSNAGYGLIGALEECSEEQIWRNFNVNLFGPLRVIRAVLPILRGQRGGHIVHLSAAAAIANYPGFSIYGGAKCAVEGVAEALDTEVKPLGIKVTLVQPGPFRTDFIARSLDRAAERLPAYDATSRKFRALLEKMDGAQPGDPARAAEAILKITAAPNPPLRLVLGKYAQAKVVKKCEALRAELEAWKELGLATEFR